MTDPSSWVCLDCEMSWRGESTCPHCARTVDAHDGLYDVVNPSKCNWTHEVPVERRWAR